MYWSRIRSAGPFPPLAERALRARWLGVILACSVGASGCNDLLGIKDNPLALQDAAPSCLVPPCAMAACTGSACQDASATNPGGSGSTPTAGSAGSKPGTGDGAVDSGPRPSDGAVDSGPLMSDGSMDAGPGSDAGDAAMDGGDAGVDACVINDCEGCGPLSQPVDSACGECGANRCDTDLGDVACADPGRNACGGCTALVGEPGAACGCGGQFVFQCDGTDTVRCTDPGANVCGGCGVISGTLNGSCGSCGRQECNPAKTALACNDPGVNACGGCGTISGTVDSACGNCGRRRCNTAKTALDCVDPGLNACGGCGTITGTVGASCGNCGNLQCNPAKTALACSDPGLNVCGGCGAISGTVGGSCGNCGSLQCNPAKTALTCNDPGLNTCGGCGSITVTIGAGCGQCGMYACNTAKTAAVCSGDHARNACNGCNTLSNAVGDRCGTCGRYECNPSSAGNLRCNDPGASCSWCELNVNGPLSGVAASDHQCLDFDRSASLPGSPWSQFTADEGELSMNEGSFTSSPRAMRSSTYSQTGGPEDAARLNWTATGSGSITSAQVEAQVYLIQPPFWSVDLEFDATAPTRRPRLELLCLGNSARRFCISYVNYNTKEGLVISEQVIASGTTTSICYPPSTVWLLGNQWNSLALGVSMSSDPTMTVNDTVIDMSSCSQRLSNGSSLTANVGGTMADQRTTGFYLNYDDVKVDVRR